MVSPQVARTPRETAEPKPLTFEVLRDFGNRVAEEYGLVFTLPDDVREIYLKIGIDLARGNGDGTWRLPIPARFVIDRKASSGPWMPIPTTPGGPSRHTRSRSSGSSEPHERVSTLIAAAGLRGRRPAG